MFFSKKKEEKSIKPAKVKKPKEEPEMPAKDETIMSPQSVPPANKPLKPSQIREMLQQGWVRVLVTFELAGKPRQHIDETLHAFIENIRNEPRVRIINEEYADAIEHADGIFSAFVEMEAVVQDLEVLTWLAINFTPASIEILEPKELTFPIGSVTNWYNDLLAKLHETSNSLRTERAVTTHLTEAMNALLKNIIVSAIRDGDKTAKEIESIAGVPEQQLEPFLKHLVESKKIVEKGQKYSLS